MVRGGSRQRLPGEWEGHDPEPHLLETSTVGATTSCVHASFSGSYQSICSHPVSGLNPPSAGTGSGSGSGLGSGSGIGASGAAGAGAAG